MADDSKLLLILESIQPDGNVASSSQYHLLCQSLCGLIPLLDVSDEALCSILIDICLPALQNQATSSWRDGNCKIGNSNVVELLETIVHVCKKSLFSSEILLWFIHYNISNALDEIPTARKIDNEHHDLKQLKEKANLQVLHAKVKEWDSLPLEAHLTLLSALLKSEIILNPVCTLLLRGTFDKLMVLIFCEEESISFYVKQSLSTIPSFFKQNSLNKHTLIESFWNCCEKVPCERDKQSKINKEIIILCTLMDDTSWEEYLYQVLNKSLIWHDIVFAMSSGDCLTRKRALYIHKSVVSMCKRNPMVNIGESHSDSNEPLFVWSLNDKERCLLAWEKVFLFFDTLEEKQPHIILPVLEQYPSLEELFSEKNSAGVPHMHPIWLEAIFKRGLEHETKVISDRMLNIILNSNPSLFCQTEQHCGWDFIIKTLLPHLNSIRLYDAQSISQSLPVIVPRITHFLSMFMALLSAENQSDFITKLISSLLNCASLSHVPMFYITYALSTISFTCTIPCDVYLLKELKSFLQSGLTNYAENIKYGTISNLLECFKMFCDQERDVEIILDIVNILRELPGFTATKTFSNFVVWLLKDNSINENKVDDGVSSSMLIFSYASKQMMQCFNTKLDYNQYLSRVLSFISLLTQHSSEEFKIDEDRIINIWKSIFSPVENILSRILTSPYIDLKHVEVTLVFYCTLVKYSKNIFFDAHSRLFMELNDFIFSHLSDVLHYFFINLFTENHSNLLLELLDSFLQLDFENKIVNGIFDEIESILDSMVGECIKILNGDKKMGYEGLKAYKMLNWICTLLSKTKILKGLKNTLLTCLAEISLEIDYSQLSLKDHINSDEYNNHFASDYIIVLWSSVKYYLQHRERQTQLTHMSCSSLGGYTDEIICEKGIDCLDLTPGEGLLPILESLCILLPNINNISALENILHAVWNLICNFHRRSSCFSSIFVRCIQILFHSKVLELCNNDLNEQILLQWKWILDSGQERRGIVAYTVSQVITGWKAVLQKDKTIALKSMSKLIVILENAVIFGPIHKRDAYIIQNASKFAKSNISKFSSTINSELIKDVFSEANRFNEVEDKSVRIQVLSLLIELCANGDVSVAFCLISDLIKADLIISEKKHRYYPDSLVHRIKIRTMQTILVLLHYFNEDQLNQCSEMVYTMLLTDNLPIIRHMNEWIIIVILNHCPSLHVLFWKRLSTANERRLTNLSSLIMIAYHSTLLMKDNEFENTSAKLLDFLLPWTQVQHVGVRMNAFVAMKGIWDEFGERKCQKLLDNYSVLQSSFVGDKHTSCAIRQRQQYIEDFFFSDFKPSKHVSLEVIFKTFLELSNVAENEFIDIKEFDHLESVLKCPCCQFSLRDGLPKLSASKSHIKVNQFEKGANPSVSLDVQKKITPSKVIPPVDDPILRSMHVMKKINKPSLIVCASLIDRPANLGGLCRTCEILGASTFIVGSYHYVDDSNFKALSVTSEKWMNIEQVMPRQLEEYVESMVRQGYTAVGLEQTAQSVKMQDYQFNKKTLLILGNEKEGIPVRIIQQLSTCIEIPQSGIIRSLNVHTSGAIAIWEYCKQML